MVKKFIEISNPNDGKGMEKFVKCYSDLTGKNSFILTCHLSTLIAKECSENMIVYTLCLV
jgi:hypothetical protein